MKDLQYEISSKIIFGDGQPWRLRKYNHWLEQINRIGSLLRTVSDESLQKKSQDLRKLASGGILLDEILVEAYALVREAAHRTLGLRHFNVQLHGAMALHDGLIAEMKTGEGKTLVAALPVYLNALTGNGVHVVTVNDYLAKRDAEWMGPLYQFLGLSVGVILEEMGEDDMDEIRNRRDAYRCDITYGTNHEIVFDYLRDNMAMVPEEVVQREFNYVIVDEVDLLLIDEARTPLVISGSTREDLSPFKKVNKVVRCLDEGTHYIVEDRTRTVSLTETGVESLQKGLNVDNLFNVDHIYLYHAVYQSLLAHGAYKRDIDYIVEDNEVFLVDEFTGRVSVDKRFADGLHQAIEAKENVLVQYEDQTLAQITYQTFYGRYNKLAGMSGTALTEKKEFKQAYGLDVNKIPTHQPMIRNDFPDIVFDTVEEKHKYIISEILELRTNGRPVLVGTSSVRESEQLSRILKSEGVSHSVLNARNHKTEAEIVAQAGRKGAVTISTNMAGRGTDIILGGNPEMIAVQKKQKQKIDFLRTMCAKEKEEVISNGGLHVIGTAHHESVRIDDQLRGRAGRQGDPGSSQYIISLDDDIWKKFGKSEIEKLRFDFQKKRRLPGEPIESWRVNRILKKLQKKVESENKSIRLDVYKYDLVVHFQRETIYKWRRSLVTMEDFNPETLIRDVITDLIGHQYEHDTLAEMFRALFNEYFVLPENITDSESIIKEVLRQALSLLHKREEIVGRETLSGIGKHILLNAIDELWTEHLSNLERLEEGIGLWSYAEIDPLIMWRKESTYMWQELLQLIRYRAVKLWFQVDVH